MSILYNELVSVLEKFDIKTFSKNPSEYLIEILEKLNHMLKKEDEVEHLIKSSETLKEFKHLGEKILIANDDILYALKNKKLVNIIYNLFRFDSFLKLFPEFYEALRFMVKKNYPNRLSLLHPEADAVLDEIVAEEREASIKFDLKKIKEIQSSVNCRLLISEDEFRKKERDIEIALMEAGDDYLKKIQQNEALANKCHFESNFTQELIHLNIMDNCFQSISEIFIRLHHNDKKNNGVLVEKAEITNKIKQLKARIEAVNKCVLNVQSSGVPKLPLLMQSEPLLKQKPIQFGKPEPIISSKPVRFTPIVLASNQPYHENFGKQSVNFEDRQALQKDSSDDNQSNEYENEKMGSFKKRHLLELKI